MKLFPFFIFLLVITSVHAQDNSLLVAFGGDSELVIGGVGDGENTFFSYFSNNPTRTTVGNYVTNVPNVAPVRDSKSSFTPLIVVVSSLVGIGVVIIAILSRKKTIPNS